MRWLVVGVGVGVVVVAGCGGGPELPPAEVLVEDRAIASVTVTPDALYWTASVGGEANHTGRVMTVARGSGATPRVLAAEQFNPGHVVVGRDALYWGNRGDFVSCGAIVRLGPDGLTTFADACRAWPVLAADGTVTVLELTDDGSRLLELDEPTRVITTRLELAGRIDALVPGDGGITLLVADAGGGYVARLPDGEPWLRLVAAGIRNPRGVAAVDDYLYWVDAGYTAIEPVRVFRIRADGQGFTELVAAIETTSWLGAPVHVGDAIWLIGRGERDGRETGELIRVGQGGAVDHFPLDVVPRAIAADGAQLVLLTDGRVVDGLVEPTRILAQRLP